MSTRRRRGLARALACGLALAIGAAEARASTPSPREVVTDTTTRVIEVLRDGSADPAAKRKRIEEIAYAQFDFDVLSRLVLARNWSRLSADQQARFIEEFRRHLSVTYGRNLDSYDNETVAVVGEREEARGDWSVKTKIVRGGGSADIAVDYRLRKAGDAWKVIDVTVEGVSLVANFRAQFQEILAQKSPDQLLALLAEKNASGESILPPGKANGATGAS